MSDSNTIIIADDHPLFRAALRDTLSRTGGLGEHAEIVEAADFTQLQTCVEQHADVRLVILDLFMPGAHGFSALIFLVAHYPQIPVLMISANDSTDIIRRAADHGAAGFLSKSASVEKIEEAVATVGNGQMWFSAEVDFSSPQISDEESDIAAALSRLTPQQFRVASMLAQGLLNKQIAYELDVTEATIKAHITEIFRKLGVHSRTQAALALGKLDLLDPSTQTN